MGELIISFKKYPPWAWWVMGGQIVSELTMNSPWACRVNTPSPPVTSEVSTAYILVGQSYLKARASGTLGDVRITLHLMLH